MPTDTNTNANDKMPTIRIIAPPRPGAARRCQNGKESDFSAC
jgi:hypothetical protein